MDNKGMMDYLFSSGAGGAGQKVMDAIFSAYPKVKAWATAPADFSDILPRDGYDEGTGQMVHMPPQNLENPTLGGAASLMSQNMVPGGAVGAGAIALTDTAKAGGLGTVGGALARGFEEAKAAGRTWMGGEGRTRFEINDQLSKFKGLPKALTEAKLSEVLDHPTLYEQYPALKDVGVQKMIPGLNNQNLKGQFALVDGRPVIRVAHNLSPEEARSTILHEVQHVIQDKEGFAGGTNAGAEGYDLSPGEVESNRVQDRMDMSDEERKRNAFNQVFK